MADNKVTSGSGPEDTLARMERERMTRRAVLAKAGLRFGLGALALLSVDDLARMVGKHMEQQAKQNALVDSVTRELRGAGLAFAGGDPGGGPTKISYDPVLYEKGPSGCSSTATGGYCVQVGQYASQNFGKNAHDNCQACCDSIYANQCSGYPGTLLDACRNSC